MREIDRRIALAKEWDTLVEQVRQLDGFRDFLRPPPLDSLLAAAVHGPVVVVNVSRWRCDAIVVTSDGVQTVPLPSLTREEVTRRTTDYLRVLNTGAQPSDTLSFTEALEAREKERRNRENVLRSTTEWLWDVIAEPVFDVLRIAGPPGEGVAPPRLWWCPTGLLTLLPLHGAGYHSAADGRTVLDRVVSSYTPTLRVLKAAGSAGEEAAPPAAPLLFVGVPDVLGQVELTEDVTLEKDFLVANFPGGIDVVEGVRATTATVQAAMADHRWIHLSCHGYQNLDDPSAAGFMLSDGTLTILRISADRYAGEFAFLSACRTATGGLDLPDEVITLAAALNYTGYRHVVATLWSVDPAVAAEMTTSVYRRLIEADRFDPDRSAFALHEAVRALRDDRRPLDDWLPFIHTGR